MPISRLRRIIIISEIDVRDWDNTNPQKALESLDNLKYAVGTAAFYDDFSHLKEFIRQVELIRRKQVKQTAALLKG